MPKIIKNLNEKIIKSCTKLFGKHGYENVEMKMIAHECNVAVGTLYNYYSSKWNIYEEVLNLFWNEMNIKMDDISAKKISDEEKLKELVSLLSEELNCNSALCEVFYNKNMNEVDYDKVEKTRQIVLYKIEELVKPLIKNKVLIDQEGYSLEVAEIILMFIIHYRNRKDMAGKFMMSFILSAIN